MCMHILCYPGALLFKLFPLKLSDPFFRTGILHLLGARKVRITQTKYLRSEVEVEIMHLSPQTQGSISPPGHTANRLPFVSDIS